MESKSQSPSEGHHHAAIVKGFTCHEWRHPLATVNEDGQWPRPLMLRLEKSLNDQRRVVFRGAIWLLLWQPLTDKSPEMISMHGSITTKLLHQWGKVVGRK